MAKIKTLEDLLNEEIKDLYSAEKQITKALPKMIKAASSQELKDAFQNHLTETENQISRLEEISQITGESLTGKKCKAMEGLLEEGSEVMKEDMDPEVMNAALIAAGQKVEHYEIASYGTAVAFAELLGKSDIADLLNETLEEEKNADETLSDLAENINVEAMNEEDNDEEDEEGNEGEEESGGTTKSNGRSKSTSKKGSRKSTSR